MSPYNNHNQNDTEGGIPTSIVYAIVTSFDLKQWLHKATLLTFNGMKNLTPPTNHCNDIVIPNYLAYILEKQSKINAKFDSHNQTSLTHLFGLSRSTVLL